MRQEKKAKALLEELVARAKGLGIEVRTEKLLREVGYRAHSGRCRLNGKELIIIDRDAPLTDQVGFLKTELSEPPLGSSLLLQYPAKTRPSPP